LRFGVDDEPGIRRRGHRRPTYTDEASGRAVHDRKVLDRIEHLAVPPAWSDVWIASDPRSHVQATGRDARGRKQYRYHPRYRAHREEAKFDLLVPFGHALPQLRTQVDRDLRRHGVPRERVIAAVVELLDRTLIRVGNEEYARENGSFGLTTLRNRHVHVEGSHLRMHFAGKSNKEFDVRFDDPRLARIVTRCQDLPGQLLFQYVNGDGTPRPVRSSDVNEYLRDHSGLEATAKTFRTWNATVYAAAALAVATAPASVREGKATVSAMLEVVSGELNNTPAVCRRSYIHPALFDAYLDGTLQDRWADASARGSRQLTIEERKTLSMLEHSGR
jgi:DNA topoisomerase-1